VLLPRSQKPATCPGAEPKEFSLHHTILSSLRSVLIPTFRLLLGLTVGLFLQVFPPKLLRISLLLCACHKPIRLILLRLNALTLCGEE
jgi:hypothetical protein